MSYVTNIMMFIFMYPVIFILYFVQKGEGLAKSGYLFSIHYTKDWLSDTERSQFETEYRQSMNRFLLIYSLSPVITFFIPYTSISLSFWMLWMTAAIIASQTPYFKANRKLLALKKERVHQQETTAHIVYAEIKNAGMIRRVKLQQFIAPILIGILLAIFSIVYFYRQHLEVFSITNIIFALTTPFFYFFAVCMDKMKTKVVSSDSTVNVNYARACKHNYKNFWVACSWVNTGFIAVIVAVMTINITDNVFSTSVILWATIIYSIIVLLFCMRMVRNHQMLFKQYEKNMDLNYDEEEDAWIGGMFYYNPKDKHTMVSKRVGIGTTVNMATPAGKGFMGFTGLVFLSFPIMCIWIILLEFTPISLFVKNDTLIAQHLNRDYVIAVDTITNLSLENELPKSSKISGTGMDTLKQGTFRNTVDGRIQMFLNPQNQYYMRLVSNGVIYYLGGYDDAETLTVYEQLTQ